MSLLNAIGVNDSTFDLKPIARERIQELEIVEAVGNITTELDEIDRDFETVENLTDDIQDINHDYLNLLEVDRNNIVATQVGLSNIQSRIKRLGVVYGLPVSSVTTAISVENISSVTYGVGLEAVNGMIADIVRGIKSFIEGVWEKFQDFWKRNFAEMTRIYKAIVRIKDDVKKRKGELPSNIGKMESPIKFVKVLTPDGDITPSTVFKCMSKQEDMSKNMGSFTDTAMLTMERAAMLDPTEIDKVNDVFDAMITQFRKLQEDDGGEIVFGTEEDPLSKFTTAKITVTHEESEKSKKLKVKFETGKAPLPDDDRFLIFGDKSSLLKLVSGCEGLYTITDRLGKGLSKQDRRFQSLFDKASKNIEKQPKTEDGIVAEVVAEAKANAKLIADIYSQFAGILPKMSSFMIRMNLDLIKVVIHYINTCLDKFQ